jgi:hypothetical protein
MGARPAISVTRHRMNTRRSPRGPWRPTVTNAATAVVGAVAIAAAAALHFGGTPAGAFGQHGLAAVRASTAGYVDLDLCFDQMGEHFGRPEAFDDGVLTATEPEALVYAHVGDRLQLVAVEYVSTRPGEVLGMPLHFNSTVGLWVLHAWVWDHNPDGVHADFNPNVGDCP